MSGWNQPICERDWIDRHGTWEPVDPLDPKAGEKLTAIRKAHRLTDPELERCSYCGEPTIFGAYVRDDPANVPFPPDSPEKTT